MSSKMKAGFIGFLQRNLSQEEKFDLLKQYAEAGYQGMESGDFIFESGDPAENLKRLQEIGLTPLAVNYPMFTTDLKFVPEVAEKAHLAGVHRIAIFGGKLAMYRFGMQENRVDYDEFMEELEGFEAISKAFEKEGLITSYHNHHAEFISYYKGEPAYYHMMKNTEALKFELDLGWALYGHFNPLDVMDDLGDKLCAIHVKDYTYGNVVQKRPGYLEDTKLQTPRPHYTTPGTGMLPLYECLKKAAKMGIDYAILEMDFMNNMTNLEALRGAYLNMKESGFVE